MVKQTNGELMKNSNQSQKEQNPTLNEELISLREENQSLKEKLSYLERKQILDGVKIESNRSVDIRVTYDCYLISEDSIKYTFQVSNRDMCDGEEIEVYKEEIIDSLEFIHNFSEGMDSDKLKELIDSCIDSILENHIYE